MAKGDYIRFVGLNGKERAMFVEAAGRRLELTFPIKSRLVWAAATEYTRGGKQTGAQILCRLEALDRIESKIEPRNVKPKVAKPKLTKVDLMGDA
jgi:hypothetical protein